MQKVPTKNFQWAKELDIFTSEFTLNHDENGDTGYIFEVDIEYPSELEDLHSDYSFFPEWKIINKCSKLVTTLEDKKYYVTHINMLKMALKRGLN